MILESWTFFMQKDNDQSKIMIELVLLIIGVIEYNFHSA